MVNQIKWLQECLTENKQKERLPADQREFEFLYTAKSAGMTLPPLWDAWLGDQTRRYEERRWPYFTPPR